MKRMKSTHTPAKKLRQRGYATPQLEVKCSICIFWFRAIWLRSKRLPFGWMRIGNDLEMSGVL